MGILIRLAVSAFTVWLATFVISGITVSGDTGKKVLTLIAVAAIFGVVNAVLRPIIKTIGCFAYVLTLGLISLVVNGALLLLTSKIAETLDLPFHVDKFWPTAVLGALFIGIVSWLLNFFVPDGKDKKRRRDDYDRRPPQRPQQQQYGGYQQGYDRGGQQGYGGGQQGYGGDRGYGNRGGGQQGYGNRDQGYGDYR
ncbi:phage holin family protein [Dactylosporangium vinaceum]|nr:phage holin family protein [Dactylosporangium vinaceum]